MRLNPLKPGGSTPPTRNSNPSVASQPIHSQSDQSRNIPSRSRAPLSPETLLLSPETRQRAAENQRAFRDFGIDLSHTPLSELIPVDSYLQAALEGLTNEQKDLVEERLGKKMDVDPISLELIRENPVWIGSSPHPMELDSLTWLTSVQVSSNDIDNGSSARGTVIRHPSTNENIDIDAARRSFNIPQYCGQRGQYIEKMLSAVDDIKQSLRLPNSPYESDINVPSQPTFSTSSLNESRIQAQFSNMTTEKSAALPKLRKELPSLPEAALHDLYDHLSKFETVILVDKNATNCRHIASISSHRREQTCDQQINDSVDKIVRIMGCIDPSGVDIVASNNNDVSLMTDIKNLSGQRQLNREIFSAGQGGDNLQVALDYVKVQINEKTDRPFHVFIVTGGGWDNTDRAVENLHSLALEYGALDIDRLDGSAGGELNKFQIVHHNLNMYEDNLINQLDNEDEQSPVGGFVDATASYYEERPQFQAALDRAHVRMEINEDFYMYKLLKGATMPEVDSLDKGDQHSDKLFNHLENLGFTIDRY
ncbi:MAG: hypothetical protein ACJAUP_002124 [Cellvibrionaceae bacterium]|jgi:hypothetical protein